MAVNQNDMNEFENKQAAVIGLARAGLPAAQFLLERGAHVVGYDSKARQNATPEMLALEVAGAELRLGEHGFAGIDECDLVVLSPGLKVHYEPLKSVIERVEAAGGEVIGELELASRFCPCPMIAVTGTKGKSTTVKLITEMLRACGVNAVSAGNTGTPLISALPQLSADSWAVVEVSSFQLEKAPTFRPRVAVLLSLLEDHQDYHPDLEQYWETKLKIFENQDEKDWPVFNIDDPRVLKEFLKRGGDFGVASTCHRLSEFPDIRWFDGQRDDFFIARVWKENNNWQIMDLPPLGFKVEEGSLKGQHNQSNIAAALCAVDCAIDVSPHLTQIAEVIKNFQSLPHRLEFVAQKEGVTYVNDSQSTIPDAAIAALKAFPAPVSLLLGGRAKIAAESYQNLMRAVREANAKIYLFGEAAGLLEEVAHRESVENLCIFRENTLAEVLQLAKMKSTSGETIVLSPACASFDQFSSYEDRGETFRRLVHAL